MTPNCTGINKELMNLMDTLKIKETQYFYFLKEEMKEKAKLEEEKKDEEKEDPKGIPEFWLTVFKNVDLLSDMVQVSGDLALFQVALVINPSAFKKAVETLQCLMCLLGSNSDTLTWMSYLVTSQVRVQSTEIPPCCFIF